jgi:hypothetical protein
MRKLPILVTLLTTMIASTLSTIVSHTSFLPVEGYYYDEENPPVSFSVSPSSTDYFEGDGIDYSSWVFTIFYSNGDYEHLNYDDSEWLYFSIPHGTTLLDGDDKTYVDFEDTSNGISFFAEIYLTITRVVQNFVWVSGTKNFVYGESLNYDDWIFDLTYYNGDTAEIYANDPNISFTGYATPLTTHGSNYVTVTYNNPLERVDYNTAYVTIEVDPIVTDIEFIPPGGNPVEGDIVDYTDWNFDLVYSDLTTMRINYPGLWEITPSQGSTWSTSDLDVYVRYVDENVDFYDSYSITVDMREFSYVLGTVTPFTNDTYFIGDVLDFTDFQVEVIEENYGYDITTLYSGDSAINFYYLTEFGYVQVYDGYELTDYEFLNLSEIHFEINYEDFYYDTFFDVGTPIPITIYPEPTYQLNFKNLVPQDVSVLTDSRQASIVGDATWLIKADQPTSLQSVEAVDSPGLVIGDDLEADFATDISFLSSSLWGVGGAASGYPIIESIYLKAYSVNTQVEFFINDESVGFNNLNTEAGDDWIVFTIDPITLRVGHLEMRLLQAAGDTPITLEELNIVSSEYPTIDLLDMLSFANTVESLDTCADQSGFLTTEVYDEYEYYLETFGDIFTDLMLLDLSTPESNRDELRVTLGDKWAMMDGLHGEDDVPLGSRVLNQPANTTNTFWLGFSLILILFTFFWKKRTSDILR